MWILMVMTLSGTPAQWGAFSDSTEAACHKTRLFEYNRKNPVAIRRHGWDIPKDWASYDKYVTVKRKD